MLPTTVSSRVRKTRRDFAHSTLGLKFLLCAALIYIPTTNIVFYKSKSEREFESRLISSVDKVYEEQKEEAKAESCAVNHPDYEIASEEFIRESRISLITYRHKKTGAEIASLHWPEPEDAENNSSNEEKEKAFGIFFRTPVDDSTGKPHILEHSLLCGSKKYTTKEPFADLLKTSPNTFLNAFTWDDRTGFGFASCVHQDFLNLHDVYMDAVFNPRVRHDKYVLAQEGWHLEPKGAGNKEEEENVRKAIQDGNIRDVELAYSGVVFSEMKGVYSDVDSVAYAKSQEKLFKDTTYKNDSGGNPKVIPQLTFEDFAAFYDKHYHPSNSMAFVSGLEKSNVFEFLQQSSKFYNNYDAAPEKKVQSRVKMQKKNYAQPVKERYPYASEKGDNSHVISVTWLVNDETLSDAEELALSVLDRLLLGTRTASLYKTLSESGLGEQLDGGLSCELVQCTYSVSMKGVNKENVVKFEKLLQDSLKTISVQGFDERTLESTMNIIEFSLREDAESSAGGESKGIGYMFAIMSKWNYDHPPSDALRYQVALNRLKHSIKNGQSQIFKDLISKYLIHNTHRVTIEMYPSAEHQINEVQEEKERIQNYKDSLTDSQLQEVIDFAIELKRQQAKPDTKEDLATIPTVSLSDINPTVNDYPITIRENAYETGVTVVEHDLPCSGIIHADLALDISVFSLSTMQKYFHLFTSLIGKTGTWTKSDVELTQEIETHTGGIGLSSIISQVKDPTTSDHVVMNESNFVTKVVFRGKALVDKTDKMFDLMYELLTEAKLDDKQKALEIMKASCSSQESAISSSGNSYALTRLKQRYNVAGIISEKLGGVTSYNNCKELLEQIVNDWENTVNALKEMRQALVNKATAKKGMYVNLTGDKDDLEKITEPLKAFLNKLPGDIIQEQQEEEATPVQHPWLEEALLELEDNQKNPIDEALIVPTKVSYVAKSSQLYSVGEKVSGATEAITASLSRDYLWNTVRIQGNAYGAGAYVDPSAGVMALYSYRDPNIQSTLNFMEGIASFIEEKIIEFEQDPKALEKVIIGAISKLDGSPPGSSEKGWVSFNRFLVGSTKESRQQWRDELLGTSVQDFKDFLDKLKSAGKYSLVVVTSDPAYNNADLGDKSVVRVPVL